MKNFVVSSALLASSLFATSLPAHANTVDPVVEKSTCDKPVYPKSALMNEESGTVALSILVNPDGTVADTKVDKTSGSKTLDKATAKIFSSCKFKPGTKDGKPQQLWVKVEYAWNLS